eukprot:6123730-Prymnesium_polylepis.2
MADFQPPSMLTWSDYRGFRNSPNLASSYANTSTLEQYTYGNATFSMIGYDQPQVEGGSPVFIHVLANNFSFGWSSVRFAYEMQQRGYVAFAVEL